MRVSGGSLNYFGFEFAASDFKLDTRVRREMNGENEWVDSSLSDERAKGRESCRLDDGVYEAQR